MKPSGSRSGGPDVAPDPGRKAAVQVPSYDRLTRSACFRGTTPEPRDSPEPGKPPDDGNLERLLYTRAAPTADIWNFLCQHEYRLATLTSISLKGVFDAAVPGNQRDPTWSKTKILNALAVFLKHYRETTTVQPSEQPRPAAGPEHPEQPPLTPSDMTPRTNLRTSTPSELG